MSGESETVLLEAARVDYAAALRRLDAADALNRPSVIFKPVISQDGDKWCALLGENIQVGVVAFGDTPEDAMKAFDKEWTTKARTVPR